MVRGPASFVTSLIFQCSLHILVALVIFRIKVVLRYAKYGGRSSTVEHQIVILGVAGSNPVDHPMRVFTIGQYGFP